MRRTKWNALAFLFSGALVLAACGQEGASPTGDAGDTPAPTGTDGAATEPPSGQFSDSITIALDGQVRQVSNANTDVPTGRLLGWIYNALYTVDDSLAPVPDLLQDLCDVSEDETTYTCTLKEGLTFHNGDELTTDDVVFTYELGRSESCSWNPSTCSAIASITNIEAIDDLTVEFTLDEPFAPFAIDVLSGVLIDSRDVVEAAYEDFTGAAGDLTPDDIQAVRDAATEAGGGEEGEPDPDACETVIPDAEEILGQLEVELPDREAYEGEDGFDSCGYLAELGTDLGFAQSGLEAEGTDAVSAAYRLLPFNKDPVGSGPYMWDTFTAGQSIVMTAFADYHEGAPATPTINWQIITDQVASAAALDAGEVDLSWDLTPDGFTAVEGNESLQFAEYPGFVHLEIQFNVREGRVFSDPNLRQAMAMCFDKGATVDAATDGLGIPMQAPIPPASWAFNTELQPIAEDVEGARALIEESGWTEGADGIYEKEGERLEFEALVREGQSDRVNFMQLFADQVARCGIGMNARPADFATVLLPALDNAHAASGFDVYFGGWFAGLDPDNYSLFACEEVQTAETGPTYNYIGYCNEESDRLLQEARTTTDQDERQQLYFEWQELFAEELPYLMAYSNIVRDGLHGGMTYSDGEIALDSPQWLWKPHALVIEE